MKKRLKMKNQQNIEKCYSCDCSMIRKKHYSYEDPFIGIIEFDGDYTICPNCNEGWLDYKMMGKRETAKKAKVAELLLMYYPIDKNEYLTLEDISLLQGKYFSKMEKDHIDLFVYNTYWNGKQVYLKKSYDLYKETGSGFFIICNIPLRDEKGLNWVVSGILRTFVSD